MVVSIKNGCLFDDKKLQVAVASAFPADIAPLEK